MQKITFLLLTLASSSVFAQAQNFNGLSFSIDYKLNSIRDVSSPGGTVKSNSGMPDISIEGLKAINNNWLFGAYAQYDLGTTDTSGGDPDAQHPFEAGGKVGYAFTEKFMAYAKLGYSWSKYSSPGYYQWLRGPSYGIGAQYLITKNLFTRVEISQQNYKTIYWSDGSSDKVNINSYGVGVGWLF